LQIINIIHFLLVLSSQTNCKIFHLLFENNICLRCIFRLLKIDKIDFYRAKEEYIELLNRLSDTLSLKPNLLEIYDFKNLIKKPEAPLDINICGICLGILQFEDQENRLNDLINRIKKEDYEFNSFKLTLKIPLTATIRAYQVNIKKIIKLIDFMR